MKSELDSGWDSFTQDNAWRALVEYSPYDSTSELLGDLHSTIVEQCLSKLHSDDYKYRFYSMKIDYLKRLIEDRTKCGE